MAKNAISDYFFNRVVQDVPLAELKEVVRSCHFDENMKFCAILTKINDERLKIQIEGNFLLQIWSEGILLFQRPLQREVRAWNVSRQANSLIYLLDPEDEQDEAGLIHVVSLN